MNKVNLTNIIDLSDIFITLIQMRVFVPMFKDPNYHCASVIISPELYFKLASEDGLCRDYPNGLVRTVGHYLIYLYAE
jgi:hypothetical protein